MAAFDGTARVDTLCRTVELVVAEERNVSVRVARPLTLVLGKTGVPVRVIALLGDTALVAVTTTTLCVPGGERVDCTVSVADASTDTDARNALALGAADGESRGDAVA